MIHINLKNKSYDVIIEQGISQRAGKEILQVWRPRQVAIISDENVASRYLLDLKNQLENNGFSTLPLVVSAGENSKNLTNVNYLIEQMAQSGFTREDGVIALGGGVVGDLAGLVASLYMRGISYLQIATSLTAQVDSSVGGKTAIDLGGIKNIVGTFHQPDLVLIDPEYLKTLNERELVEGYAEVVKTSALAGGDFFELTGKINSVSDLRNQVMELSRQSILYKAKIVMKDEKESGVRKVLNFGHTFGHAIESLCHGTMLHGEAISIGMVEISKIFERNKISSEGLANSLSYRLSAVGLPTSSSLIGTPDFLKLLQNDKKNLHGFLNLVALKNIGDPIIVTKKLSEMANFIKKGKI